MAEDVITTIENKHIEGCGEPPSFDFSEYSYISYFENEHGEQSIFVCDDEEVKVYIADAGWENPITVSVSEIVTDGSDGLSSAPGIIIGGAEEEWLNACKSAITARYRHRFDN